MKYISRSNKDGLVYIMDSETHEEHLLNLFQDRDYNVINTYSDKYGFFCENNVVNAKVALSHGWRVNVINDTLYSLCSDLPAYKNNVVLGDFCKRAHTGGIQSDECVTLVVDDRIEWIGEHCSNCEDLRYDLSAVTRDDLRTLIYSDFSRLDNIADSPLYYEKYKVEAGILYNTSYMYKSDNTLAKYDDWFLSRNKSRLDSIDIKFDISSWDVTKYLDSLGFNTSVDEARLIFKEAMHALKCMLYGEGDSCFLIIPFEKIIFGNDDLKVLWNYVISGGKDPNTCRKMRSFYNKFKREVGKVLQGYSDFQ